MVGHLHLGKLDSSRRPVLLIGHLNLIRPLGLAGIPVIVVVSDPNDIALRSRYVAGHCLVPGKEAGDDALAQALLEAGAELASRLGRRLPLFYGNDRALGLIHRYRAQLEAHYLFVLNHDQLAARLADKERFHRLCVERGVPAPKTVAVGESPLEELARLRYPVIIKPKQKVYWLEMKRALFRGHGKARILERPEQLLADPLVGQFLNRLVVSEYIPGDDSRNYSYHGFADRQSRVLAWFAGRKIRTCPELTGESSFIELVKEPALVAAAQAAVRRLGLRGPFKIDIKKSAADEQYYALEVNARFNLWHYLGAVNGVNIPQVAYQYLTEGEAAIDRPHQDYAYQTDYRWLNFYLDYVTVREMRSRGQLSYRQWLRSLMGRKVYSAFAWEDPLPFLSWMGDFLREKARRNGRRAG